MSRFIVLATVLAGSLPVVAISAEPKAPATPRPSNVRTGQAFQGSGIVGNYKTQAERDIEQYERVVKLSDDQKQRIKEIYDARDLELKEFQTSIQEKMPAQQAAMNEAAKSGDPKKQEEARRQYMALFAPQQAIVKRGAEKLKSVLTTEQRELVQEDRFLTAIAAYAPGVELTEGQLNLLYISSTTGSGELEGFEGLLPELLSKTLTAEQIKTVLKHRLTQNLTAMYRNVTFHPDQQAKIDALIAAMLETHPKTMYLDGAVYQKLREYVNSLLTAEQRETMRLPRAS